MRRLAALAWIAAACHPSRPPLASCADPLAGVWQDDHGRRWQIVDHAAKLEVYPLFDTADEPLLTDGPEDAGPARAPIVVVLEREGSSVEGTASFRLTRAGADCLVKYPFRVTGCGGSRATLSYQEVTAISAGCNAAYAPVWNDVPIVRE